MSRRSGGSAGALFGEIEPVVDLAGCEVANCPVGHAQAHVRLHGREDMRGEIVEKPVEAAGGLRFGGGGVDAEAKGDQVESPVAAASAVPVDDAGDVAVAGEEVGGLVVAVDSVVAAEVTGMAGADGGDPAVERPGAGAVLAQWLVQAVARSVASEVQLDRGTALWQLS